MLTSNGLVLEKPLNGGVQRIYRCSNGCGLSLVKSPVSFGLWELGVFRGVGIDGNGGRLCYDTGVTDDVLRFSGSDEDVSSFILDALDKLSDIKLELPAQAGEGESNGN